MLNTVKEYIFKYYVFFLCDFDLVSSIMFF